MVGSVVRVVLAAQPSGVAAVFPSGPGDIEASNS
jgi:hypothetical protein